MKGKLSYFIKGFIGVWLCCLTTTNFAQGDFDLSVNKQFGVEVRLKGNLFKQLSLGDLKKAKTLSDINEGFPDSWIASYLSVNLWVNNNGEKRQVSGTSHEFNKEQLEILRTCGFGSEVTVEVRYIPENAMNSKGEKKINFALMVTPEKSAEYVGGFHSMRSYLMQNTLDKIPYAQLYKLHRASVQFTIDENGQSINAILSESSSDEKADKLILEAIKSMPRWKPAATSDGTVVKQDFIFSVGEQIGC